VAMRTKLMDAEFAKAGKEAQRTAQAARGAGGRAEKKAAQPREAGDRTWKPSLRISTSKSHVSQKRLDVELYKRLWTARPTRNASTSHAST